LTEQRPIQVVADGGENGVGGIALAPFEIAAAEMAIRLHVSDHSLDSGAATQLSFDETKDATLLAGDEDAVRIGGVVAAIALVDIGTLDCATGELLGGVDDAAERMSVVGTSRQRLGVEHKLAAGSAGICGDDRGLDAEFVGRAGFALADAFDLGRVEGIELPPALALLLGTDLLGARERPFQYGLEIGLPGDLAADIADEAAKSRSQEAQLAMMTLELLGVGIASRHHGGAFGDAQIRLAQLQPASVGQPIEPLDCRMQQLGVSREGDGLGLDRGVHSDPFDIAGAQRAGCMRHAQALSQQELELAAEPLPPMAEVGALVRKVVLKKLLAGEVLEVRVIDPALTHAFVGQAVDVLEQKQPDDEARLNPRPTIVAVKGRHLAIDPIPVDPGSELYQLMLQVDDLIEASPEQIACTCRPWLIRSHRHLRCGHRITIGDSPKSQIEIASFRPLKP
jgi:hypothetical protein